MKRSIIMTMLFGGMLSPVLADSTWFIYGNNGYVGSVDTKLASSAPTTNYSTANIIQTRYASAPLTVSLVKFGSLNLPDNAEITKAQLRIYVNGVYNTGTFQIWAMQKDWASTTTTWNTTDGTTAWATAGALGTADRGSAAIAQSSTIAAAGYYTIDLTTSLVQSWIDTPATNYGLQMASIGGLGLDITANEITWGVSYRPSLYVEYDIVPEPASMSLILIVSLGMFVSRKRK